MNSNWYFYAQNGNGPMEPAPIEEAPLEEVTLPSTDFPAMPDMVTMPETPSGAVIPTTPGAPVMAVEESYLENILRQNRGKVATVYMTFEGNNRWNAMIFRGTVEGAGRDHLILSNPQTGKRYLLKMVNLDYVTFDEPINYYYPIDGASGVTR